MRKVFYTWSIGEQLDMCIWKKCNAEKAKGCTNLWNHVIALHPDYENTENESTLIDYASSEENVL